MFKDGEAEDWNGFVAYMYKIKTNAFFRLLHY